MTNNPKNDHSISMDELTGGVALPQSSRPIKVDTGSGSQPVQSSPEPDSSPAVQHLPTETAQTHTYQPVSPVVDSTPSESPIALHDEAIAGQVYRINPSLSFDDVATQASAVSPDTSAHIEPTPTPAPTALPPQIHSEPVRVNPMINLKPDLDADQFGLRNEDGVVATNWLSRFSHLLHIRSFFTKQRMRYLLIAVFSFAVFYIVFNYQLIVAQLSYTFNPPKQVSTVTVPSGTPTASTAAVSQAEIVPPENIIVIPKINVTAPVILEPSMAEKNIQQSLQNGVVHYSGTALPGEKGNVAIVGHSSNDWWEPGSYKFVFALLEKMTPGDKIQVNYSSRKYVYQITEKKVVEPTDLSVLAPTTDPTLTLITCTPPGTSWKRLIIRAVQIEPAVSAPKVELASTVSPTTNSKASAALPGNAPSLLSQIGSFFGRIWEIFFKKPADSTTQPAPAQPAQHLPELQ